MSSPRLHRRRTAALRLVDRQLQEFGRRRRILEPLAPFEIAPLAAALVAVRQALSREAGVTALPTMGETPLTPDMAVALLERLRACLAPPRPAGHARNRVLGHIPEHYGLRQTYPRDSIS